MFGIVVTLASARAQNLVPNPSFEDTVHCPQYTDEVQDASGWMNFGNSPDYYNGCASGTTTFVSIPNAGAGFQYAHSGVAMAGLITWSNRSNGLSQFNYRENIGTQLSNTMIIGQKYFFSFYTNYSGYLDGWREVASDKIGLRFSTIPYDSANRPPLTNFAHLYSSAILNDTVNWIKLSASFIADSAYQYVAVGNFFDDFNTDTSSYGNPLFGSESAYYYVDDICVSTDSLYNETWTGSNEQNINNTISVFPNPANELLNIISQNSIKEIEITNIVGQLVYYNITTLNNCIYQIPIKEMINGVYIITVKTNGRQFNQKIIKNK